MQEERKPVFATRNKMAASRVAPPFSQLNSPLSPLAFLLPSLLLSLPSPPSSFLFGIRPWKYVTDVIYARRYNASGSFGRKVEQPKVSPPPSTLGRLLAYQTSRYYFRGSPVSGEETDNKGI